MIGIILAIQFGLFLLTFLRFYQVARLFNRAHSPESRAIVAGNLTIAGVTLVIAAIATATTATWSLM